jgi:hypothetical protein
LKYGPEEYRYARPIAGGLIDNAPFRIWLLEKTRFREDAKMAQPLHKEQKARRTVRAENWWRCYYVKNSSCSCGDCGERETDLLAIFSTPQDYRFALHVEVKSPHDKFSLDQAKDYGRRANCWKGREKAPRTVLPHDEATTVLACERSFVSKNANHASLFDTVVSFDEIASWLSPYPDPKTP